MLDDLPGSPVSAPPAAMQQGERDDETIVKLRPMAAGCVGVADFARKLSPLCVNAANPISFINAAEAVCIERGWGTTPGELMQAIAFYATKSAAPKAAPKTEQEPYRLAATPFEWCDDIKPREWIYGTHMIRRYVSVVIAPGGVGKSSWLIGEAICLASGKPLLGDQVHDGKKRVWVYNLEDPRDELQRRTQAFMLYHGVDMCEIAGRLYVDSGRDQELCIAIDDRDGSRLIGPIIDAIVSEIQQRQIDVLVIDPFVSSHRVNENDNGAIDMVAKAWGRVAEQANCSVVLVHHTRKAAQGRAVDAESARGAVSLIGAARSVRVFSRLDDDEAEGMGITEAAGRYGKWYDDKNNLAPTAGRERYYKMESHILPNGESVGVPVVFDAPTSRDFVPQQSDMLAIWQSMSPEHGVHPGSSDSFALHIAGVMRWDAEDRIAKECAAKLIKSMIAENLIRRGEAQKSNRHKRAVYLKVTGASKPSTLKKMEQAPSPDEDLFADISGLR